jgi:hypothetical protein
VIGLLSRLGALLSMRPARPASRHPANVETSRSPEYPWLVLQARSARDQSPEARESDEFWVHVHADLIARVEIRFVRQKGETPIGFGVGEADEHDDAARDEFAAVLS